MLNFLLNNGWTSVLHEKRSFGTVAAPRLLRLCQSSGHLQSVYNRILYLPDVNETVWRLFFVEVVFYEDGWGSLFSLNGQMDKFLPCTACMRKFSTWSEINKIILGPVQTSNSSCAEPNVNELRTYLMSIRFSTWKVFDIAVRHHNSFGAGAVFLLSYDLEKNIKISCID
jgi:hypothetical protein